MLILLLGPIWPVLLALVTPMPWLVALGWFVAGPFIIRAALL